MAVARGNANPDMSPATAGERARKQLLVAAGEVFAEKGYDKATSKEICTRAGMNAASVNYHFGGFEHLYTETLAHAHRQLVALEQLKAIAASGADPRRKLRAYIALVVGRLARPSTSWEMRLLSREMLSPSPACEAFVKSEILPKLAVLRGIIAEFLGVSADDPIVGRSVLTVMSPGLMLAIADRSFLTQIIPELVWAPDEIGSLSNHFENFIYAGLEGIAAQLRQEGRVAEKRRGTPKRGARPPSRGGRQVR